MPDELPDRVRGLLAQALHAIREWKAGRGWKNAKYASYAEAVDAEFWPEVAALVKELGSSAIAAADALRVNAGSGGRVGESRAAGATATDNYKADDEYEDDLNVFAALSPEKQWQIIEAEERELLVLLR